MTDLREWAVVAGIMLALTFTCRLLLIFLLSDSVKMTYENQVNSQLETKNKLFNLAYVKCIVL